jgi:drug/metabolite transporter (DMT)-like permease
MPFKLPNLQSVWMLVAAFCFAIMGAFVKIGAQKFSSMELVFYRSLFGFIIICFTAIIRKSAIKSPVLAKQITRALVGFIALVLFFYAITHLPLATAITLNYTSGIFLAVITVLFLHEKSKKMIYFAIILGFIGIVLLLKPSFGNQDLFAMGTGLLSGFGAACAYLLVKQLGDADEPDWRTVFYFTLVSSILAGCWAIVAGMQTVAWQDLPILLGIGIAATIAQLAMTRAYRTGNTLIVACLAYFTVIFASIFGVIFWQEHLDLQAWMAIALIILSGILSSQSTVKT